MAKKSGTKVSAKQNGAPVVQAKGKKGKAKPVAKPEPEESEESSEEEMPVVPEPAKRKANGVKKAAGNPPTKKQKVPEPEPEESEDDESDDAELSEEEEMEEEESEEESEEEAAPVVKAKAKNGTAAAKKPVAKPAPAAEEEEEDSDEEEEEEESEEESDEAEAAKPGAEEDESEEESEEEESEEEEAQPEPPKKKKKQEKAPAAGGDGPSDEPVTIFVGNLPKDGDAGRGDKLQALFEEQGVEVQEVRSLDHKNIAFITLANPGDKNKALKLNGTDFEGFSLRLDLAASKQKNAGNAGGSQGGNRVAMFGCKLSAEEIMEATGASDAFVLDQKAIAFLTFNSSEEAQECVKNGPVEINGSSYNVEMAKPKPDRGGRGGGRGGGFGGGRGGRGGGFGGGRGGGRGGGFGGGRGGRGGQRGGRGGQRGGQNNSGCRNCGGDGHFARECPKPVVCRKCQGEGHIASNCSA